MTSYKTLAKWRPQMGAKCELCGEDMPEGQEMFKFHGYTGPCPKSPLPKPRPAWIDAAANECADRLIVGEGALPLLNRIALFTEVIEYHFKRAAK